MLGFTAESRQHSTSSRYLLHNQIDTGFFFAAYPEADLGQVRSSLLLRDRVIAFAVERPDHGRRPSCSRRSPPSSAADATPAARLDVNDVQGDILHAHGNDYRADVVTCSVGVQTPSAVAPGCAACSRG